MKNDILSGETIKNQQEQAARDFFAEQGLEPQEYFVYSKGTNRSYAEKDTLAAAGDFLEFPQYKNPHCKRKAAMRTGRLCCIFPYAGMTRIRFGG